IPMRDGVRLHTVALVPASATPLPILLVRTPFGAARELRGPEPTPFLAELAKDGYIFVTQDIRGRNGSEGEFVTMRPLAGPGGTDESTDAYDTIDWLIAHLPGNNGRVGILGLSYRGWLAAMAGIHPHPALKAIAPQAPMADVWLGDDFYHNGAFRQTQGALYAGYIEGSGVSLPDEDPYDTFLRFPNLDSVGRAAGIDSLPSWRAFRAHPAYDGYWRSRSLLEAVTPATVPTLVVGGWWDDEDMLGAQSLYRTLQRSDRKGLVHLVMGPWSHTTIVRSAGDSLAEFPLGSTTASWYHAEVERPWFAYWLHGRGTGRFPEAWVYETGADRWHEAPEWPLRQSTGRRLYLGPGGTLQFTPPTTAGGSCDAFASDPAHPVPNAPREDATDNWLLNDQRFLAGRTDVVRWQSAPLTEDLVVAGDVAARLFASTDGTDADWIVKLIDVFPDAGGGAGRELMVNGEIYRGRYRQGFDRPRPLAPGRAVRYDIDLHQQYYRFRAGHRLMVQVQSSWFPMYDRNPQTFVPNIFTAPADAFRTARHCVHRSAAAPSHIVLPVLR
ncbi:MAG TPA: CocE/NonD family hydrolase, partial [Gemmatimonadales bacterium]|nr:CocE/NonD family hydrolase [Gemmatimonadales bacterium]